MQRPHLDNDMRSQRIQLHTEALIADTAGSMSGASFPESFAIEILLALPETEIVEPNEAQM